jgi:hypothetical protein
LVLKLSWEAAGFYYVNRSVSETIKLHCMMKNHTFRAHSGDPLFTKLLRAGGSVAA